MPQGNRSALACLTGLAAVFLASSALAQDTVQYGYDTLGRVITVTYGNGTVTTYAYDAAGNRTQVTTGSGSPGGGGLAAENASPVAIGDHFEHPASTTTALQVLANVGPPSSNPLHVVTPLIGETTTATPGGGSATSVASSKPGT